MKCLRCTGQDGAHYAFCFVAQLWDRVMGPTHPWSAPPEPSVVMCLHDVPLEDYCETCEAHAREWADDQATRRDIDDEFLFGGDPMLDPEWAHLDPPQPAAVAEDAAVAAGAPSDADWGADELAVRYKTATRAGAIHVEEAVTHLPADYYDVKMDEKLAKAEQLGVPTEQITECTCGHIPNIDHFSVTCPYIGRSVSVERPDMDGCTRSTVKAKAEPKPKQDKSKAIEAMRTAVVARQARERQEREDAVVQFVYDTLDAVPGSRTMLDDVYDAFLDWCKVTDRPAMLKNTMRPILAELGMVMEPGRIPGRRTSGRAPILVHGYTIKGQKPVIVDEPAPVVDVKAPVTKPERTPRVGPRPGSEVHKDMLKIILPLVEEHGWTYAKNRRTPKLISPEGMPVSIPGTKVMQGRSLNQIKSNLRKAGAPL